MNQESLANAELAIMELLWDESPLEARAIREALYPAASRSQHGTVQKLLQRLEEKGFVQRDRSQPVHAFSSAHSRSAYAAGQLVSLAEKLSSGSVVPLITHLVQEKKITKAEIERLRKALLEPESGKGKQTPSKGSPKKTKNRAPKSLAPKTQGPKTSEGKNL